MCPGCGAACCTDGDLLMCDGCGRAFLVVPGVRVLPGRVDIPLWSRRRGIIGHAQIDRDEAAKVISAGPWNADKHGYAVKNRGGGGQRPEDREPSLKMHRLVLGLGPDDPDVDHKNGKPADNQKRNLRVASRGDNGANLALVNNCGRSRYRGVSWHAKTGKWRVRLRLQGTSVSLGLYPTEEEAAAAVRDYLAEHVPFFTGR